MVHWPKFLINPKALISGGELAPLLGAQGFVSHLPLT